MQREPGSSKPPGIHFAGPWSAMPDSLMLCWAKDPNGHWTLPQRVWLLAMAYANGIGHAQFPDGEIGRLLLVKNRTTRKVTPAHPNSITDAIRAAKDYGLITKESSSACLVLPEHAWQRGNGGRECRTHQITAARRGNHGSEK